MSDADSRPQGVLPRERSGEESGELPKHVPPGQRRKSDLTGKPNPRPSPEIRPRTAPKPNRKKPGLAGLN